MQKAIKADVIIYHLYIKLAYRDLRVEPLFTSLTVLQISRAREDKVFILLPFKVSMARYFILIVTILTKELSAACRPGPSKALIWASDFGGHLNCT
jgi:hypothetical protein